MAPPPTRRPRQSCHALRGRTRPPSDTPRPPPRRTGSAERGAAGGEGRGGRKTDRRAAGATPRRRRSAAANIISGHTPADGGPPAQAKAAALAEQKDAAHHGGRSPSTTVSGCSREMEKDYEGFSKAVKLVMPGSRAGRSRGIHGPVAEPDPRPRGSTPWPLRSPWAAGLQNIVVDTGGGRQERHRPILKRRDGGRATFLPLDRHPGRRASGRRAWRRSTALWASPRAWCALTPAYANVFQNLLGRTVVVEDLDCGIAMARKYQQRASAS